MIPSYYDVFFSNSSHRPHKRSPLELHRRQLLAVLKRCDSNPCFQLMLDLLGNDESSIVSWLDAEKFTCRLTTRHFQDEWNRRRRGDQKSFHAMARSFSDLEHRTVAGFHFFQRVETGVYRFFPGRDSIPYIPDEAFPVKQRRMKGAAAAPDPAPLPAPLPQPAPLLQPDPMQVQMAWFYRQQEMLKSQQQSQPLPSVSPPARIYGGFHYTNMQRQPYSSFTPAPVAPAFTPQTSPYGSFTPAPIESAYATPLAFQYANVEPAAFYGDEQSSPECAYSPPSMQVSASLYASQQSPESVYEESQCGSQLNPSLVYSDQSSPVSVYANSPSQSNQPSPTLSAGEFISSFLADESFEKFSSAASASAQNPTVPVTSPSPQAIPQSHPAPLSLSVKSPPSSEPSDEEVFGF